jgi:type II secretory pathway component GspD/PulD (secretin)
VELLVQKLDRAPAMIRLEVTIGDVPTAKLPAAEAGAKKDATPIRASFVGVEEAQKNMEVLFRGQLTALDNQAAYLQAGRREPTISAINTTATGQINSVTVQNLGTLLRFTPRVNADRVVTMQLDINDSRLAPAEEGVPIYSSNKGEVVRAPVSENLMVQATVKVADGQTVLLCDMSRQAKNGKQRVMLVTVHVLPSGDQAKPAK